MPILSRIPLAPRLRQQPAPDEPAGKLASGGRERERNRHGTKRNHLGKPVTVATADATGLLIAAVDIHHRGDRMTALIDSAASDNFIAKKRVAKDILITPARTRRARLAKRGAYMDILGECDLTFRVQDIECTARFLVADEPHADAILGRRWLKDNRVLHDHELDCLYIGRSRRRRIYLGRAPHQPPRRLRQELWEKARHEFPPKHEAEFKEILLRHAAVFDETGPLPHTDFIEHDIQLTDETPFRVPPHRYSAAKREEIQRQVREMLALGVIEARSSPYSSPIVMPEKKDGSWRFCTDFRRLNSVTVPSAQPQPVIHHLIKDIGDKEYFSTIDIRRCYWQIPLTKRSQNYTAFCTPDGGQYVYTRAAFGLVNAGRTCNHLINQEVLAGYVHDFCLSYADDIVIFSNTWEDHLTHVALVLERLQIYGFACSLEKCHFGRRELAFLGHIIKSECNEAKPEHIRAVIEAQPPRTRKDLQKFLGICLWISEYIPNYSRIAAPMTNLLSPKRLYRWTAEAQQSFEAVKKACSRPLRLHRPSAGRRFYLQTDACDVGTGAVVYQLKDDGTRCIISHASAKFTKAEKGYHSNERECLAVVWALRKYKYLLENVRFTLRTDNKALTWLHKVRDERGKLTRWAMYLMTFEFDVEHVPGKDNELPDALSRSPGSEEFQVDESIYDALDPPRRRHHDEEPVVAHVDSRTLRDEVLQAQHRDRAGGTAPRIEGQIIEQDGALLFVEVGQPPRLYVPPAARVRVLEHHHDADLAGHPGAAETLRTIRRDYYWPHLRKDVRQHVRTCQECCLAKAAQPAARRQEVPRRPRRPWEHVGLDLMGPYPLTKRRKRFLLVVTDLFSRWVEAFPISDSKTDTIAALLENEVFARWGYPKKILSDNASQFRGKGWHALCAKWGAEPWTTPAYTPRANPTERRNGEIKKGLRLRLCHKTDHSRWDEYIPSILFNIRRRRNVITGFTPSMLLLGHTIRRPGETTDAYEPATKGRIDEAAQHQEESLPPRPLDVQAAVKEGDRVYVKSHVLSSAADKYCAGLGPAWEGAYEVIHQHSPQIFTVDRPGRGPTKLHVEQLKVVPKDDSEHHEARTGEPTPALPEPHPSGTHEPPEPAHEAHLLDGHAPAETRSSPSPAPPSTPEAPATPSDGGIINAGPPSGRTSTSGPTPAPSSTPETPAMPTDEGITNAAPLSEGTSTDITPRREPSPQDSAHQLASSSTGDALDGTTSPRLPRHARDRQQQPAQQRRRRGRPTLLASALRDAARRRNYAPPGTAYSLRRKKTVNYTQ